jgi:putative glutamine amidotransferase
VKNEKLVIGISDCGLKHKNYAGWIGGGDGNIEIVKLGYTDDNMEDLDRCHALVLTGGHDVNPNLYGKFEYMDDCQLDNMDNDRDDFEVGLLLTAIAMDMPVLGICRGLQITNAYFKGTLIPDLPKYKGLHHSAVDGVDREHKVKVEEGTLLAEITGILDGEINSAHHQSTDEPGKGLRINSYSTGVVEGLEYENRTNKPFFLLVQWHPERLKDKETSPFANNIRTRFLQEAANYKNENN